jgi:hypothetical protein
MTKRSACRNQLLNEVEGAEDAGTSRAFAGSASPTQRCTCQFRVLVARNRCFPSPIVNNRRARPRRSGLDSDSCKTFGVSCSGPSRFDPISSIDAARPALRSAAAEIILGRAAANGGREVVKRGLLA